mmetsp:Transcript_2553/g.5314  ORF Transcript_2553/g.5314 Transcript_2553/m.5314 type:complete len:82 (-) Transcript_2553:53-298(-)
MARRPLLKPSVSQALLSFCLYRSLWLKVFPVCVEVETSFVGHFVSVETTVSASMLESQLSNDPSVAREDPYLHFIFFVTDH